MFREGYEELISNREDSTDDTVLIRRKCTLDERYSQEFDLAHCYYCKTDSSFNSKYVVFGPCKTPSQINSTSKKFYVRINGFNGISPADYVLLPFDSSSSSKESYVVYMNLVNNSHNEFLREYLRIGCQDTTESEKTGLRDSAWATFIERKRFLGENLANLDVMDSLT
jgi:hypothetical protein